ncbi:hypothetical protein [Polynucleobacter necessarius]|uniref:LpxL/LpxP family acyltransferase n=1 Tax=Polynucleobacter necessarius TaxID=576610 RepID=UPI001E63F1C8|nr:hypothetical protein [Polynucleobacter necessarius]
MTRALTRGEAPLAFFRIKFLTVAKVFGRHSLDVLHTPTPLPARLANRNNTPVIMFTAKRKGIGAGWLMQATRLAPLSEDAELAAAELNVAIENVVLVAPEQFIWPYNRYKHPAGAELPPSN